PARGGRIAAGGQPVPVASVRRAVAHDLHPDGSAPAVNVLVLCPHFAPDVAPTGEVITSITTELAARGHQLHVVTSLPWYRHHRIESGWTGRPVRTQTTDWGRITRVHPFPTDKRNIPARAFAFAGFTALSGLASVVSRPKPDAVLAMSP